MRNLIIFIRRYFNLFLFLLLEIISLSLLFNSNNYQQAVWLHSSNDLTGYLYRKTNDLEKYFHLQQINDSLNQQNTRLLNKLASSYSHADTIVRTPKDKYGEQQYRYLRATVVNNSVSHLFNYLTIHRGKKQGIRPGMGVVSPGGVVGIVQNVGDNYATVMSLLNKDARISAFLPRSKKFGSVVWDVHPPDPRLGVLLDIPKSVKVYKGDSVLTSGYSAIFPRGLALGYVKEVALPKESNFYRITLKFAADFQALQFVYVIENFNKEEQKAVEERISHE